AADGGAPHLGHQPLGRCADALRGGGPRAGSRLRGDRAGARGQRPAGAVPARRAARRDRERLRRGVLLPVPRDVLKGAARVSREKAPEPSLLDLSAAEAAARLGEHFAARGQPRYRVAQASAWLHERDAATFDEMTDLPAAERAALAARFRLGAPALAHAARSSDGTVKHLWRLEDGELIESVLIPSGNRLTLCISSQAGCAMACVFCATGWSGYRRQLTPGEIVGQFRGARRWAAEHGLGPITNVVFMGMGEPLANRRAVMPALTLLNTVYGLGARRITVSTVGIVPGIMELAARPEQFRLAVSLHAPNHELRKKLVPVEKKYPLPT